MEWKFVYKKRSIENQWELFTAQLIIYHKQPDEGEVLHYWCSLMSNDARYTREIKSSIVMSKSKFKKDIPSMELLEDETVMCYILSVTL